MARLALALILLLPSSAVAADSYNELFGLGSHSEDTALEGWWVMDDDAANTTVDDRSSNNRNGTLNGGDNTSVLSTTGPNSWLTKALQFDGTADYIDLPMAALGGDNGTVLLNVKVDVDPPAGGDQTGFGMFGEVLSPDDGNTYPWTDGVIYCAVLRGQNATTTDRITVGNPTAALTSWRDVAIKTTPGADGWKFRIDGSNEATATGITGLYSGAADWDIGRSNNTIQDFFLDGTVSHLVIFSRHLSDAEEAEVFAGPEPVNTVAPSIAGVAQVGETLTGTDGTWALDAPFASGSNGTINLTYQWTRSDNGSGLNEADISGATSANYVPVVADVDKHVRRRERGTNDGGFDASADTNSNFIGPIAASSSTPMVFPHFPRFETYPRPYKSRYRK